MDTTYSFDNFFEHKTLDKIHEEPDTRSLQKLFKQLRRNARSVPSNLGGGQYGHLFMVMTPQEWNALPGTTPVNPPQDPGNFTLGGRVTASEIAVAQTNHDDNRKRYNKFQALKRILKNQLIAALDPAYLDPIRCNFTDMVNYEITDIMKFLQDSYGKMSVSKIEEATQNVKNFNYNPTKSINVLLTAVQDHAELLKIAGAEMKDEQVQQLAYLLINKFQIFRDALKAWNRLPPPKTWETMKEHMRTEYQSLKDVNAISIQESALNTNDIVYELQKQQEDLLHSAEKRFKSGLTEVMNLAIQDIEGKSSEHTQVDEAINNAAEINALKLEVKKLYSQLRNAKETPYGYQNNFFDPNRNNTFIPNTRGNNRKYTRQFYCWTHGAGHSGRNCKNPAEGHQPEATFRNRMGGSNYGCYQTKPRRFNNNQRNQNDSQNTQYQSEQK